VRAWSDWR